MDGTEKWDYVVIHSNSDKDTGYKVHTLMSSRLGLAGTLMSDMRFDENFEKEMEWISQISILTFIIMSNDLINNTSKLCFGHTRGAVKRQHHQQIVPIVTEKSKVLEALGMFMRFESFNVNDANFESNMKDYIEFCKTHIGLKLGLKRTPSEADDEFVPKKAKQLDSAGDQRLLKRLELQVNLIKKNSIYYVCEFIDPAILSIISFYQYKCDQHHIFSNKKVS